MKKLIATLFVAASLLIVACTREDEKPENPSQQVIAGTFWEHLEMADSFDEDGNPHRYNVLITVDFKTDTSGLIEYTAGPEENPDEQYYENYPFTYTYNAPNGIMYTTYNGEPSTLDFIVHGDEMRVYYDDYTWMVVFNRKDNN